MKDRGRWVHTDVHAYSGYRANERPRTFRFGGRDLRVKEVLKRWYEEGYECFEVTADGNDVYRLRYDQTEDRWEGIFHE